MFNNSILVLVSGNGSNLQALIDAEKAGVLPPACIKLVVSDRAGVYALERAKAAGLEAVVEALNLQLPKKERRLDLSGRILQHCKDYNIGLIIYAGFLSILSGDIIKEYSGRMINLHPSLLPKFGGQGMYGLKVHQSVLDAGEAETGCSVHLVEAGIDTGAVLLQRKIPVLSNDTAETLAKRLQKEEHCAIVEAAKIMIARLF